MKTPLYSRCVSYNFEKLFKEKGYAWFTKGEYNVNIIGIRSNQNNKVTNKYDDILVIDYNTGIGHKRQIFRITTDPGLSYVKNSSSIKGVAILAPGQYRGTYKVDLHQGKYKALCQRLKPVKVYRDNNKDEVYDFIPESIESGMFGINIHRSHNSITVENVNKYSAGCQVFADPKEFVAFMRVIEKAKTIWGNSFTYTLINETDMV